MSNAIVTNIINNIFHVIWFCSLALEPKHSPGKRILIEGTAGIVFQILEFFIIGSGIFGSMTYFVGYLLAAVIFGGAFCAGLSASPPAKSMFLISAYYCLWTFIYSFIAVVTRSFAGAGNWAIWGLRIFLNIFFLVLYQVFFKKKLLRVYREMKSGYGMIAVVSTLTFVLMTFLLIYNQVRKVQDLAHIFGVCFAYAFLVIVYVLLFRYMVQVAHANQLKQIQFHEKLLLSQIEYYEKMEQNARRTRHDFRHHNMVVMELAQQKDYQGILNYLTEYEKIQEEKPYQRFCANHTVDSLFLAYARKAEECGIELKEEIRLEERLPVSEVDLVSVLANMMENAVNGCMEAEGARRMEVLIRQKGRILMLVCRNTCRNDVLFQNGRPRARDYEGLGIESILNIAEKYHGDADFSVVDEIFSCRVLLNGED